MIPALDLCECGAYRLWVRMVIFLLIIGPISGFSQSAFNSYTLPTDLRLEKLWQDRSGFIWASGATGFFRFDGMYWQKITNPTTPISVNSWHEAEDGTIWIGGMKGEVAKVEGDELFIWKPPGVTLTSAINGIETDSNGRIWLATYGEGVFCIAAYGENQVTQWQAPENLRSNDVYSMVEDADGNIWIGTDQGVARFSTGKIPELVRQIGVPEGLPDPLVTAVAIDSDSHLWVAMYDGQLVTIQTPEGSPLSVKGIDGIQFQNLLSQAEQVWSKASDGTLYRLSGTRIIREISLPPLSGTLLLIDREGSAWTYREGFMRLFPLNIERFWPSLGSVSAIEPSGTYLWMGTEHGLWQAWPDIDSLYQVPGTEAFRVVSLHKDINDNLWIGTIAHGGWYYESKTGNLSPVYAPDQVPYPHIISIAGNDTSVWLATFGGVYHHSLPLLSATGIYHPEIDGIPIDYPYQVYTDLQSRIWLATDGQGVAVREDTSFRFISELTGTSIYSMVQTRDGAYWLCSEDAGLYRIIQDKVELHAITITSGQLIPGSVAPISGNRLFVSHTSGCGIYNPADKSYIELGTAWSPRPVSAGLHSLAVGQKDDVWLGTEQGLLRLKTGNTTYQRIPQPEITQLLVNLEPLSLSLSSDSMPVQLQSDQCNLIIKYSGLWYQDPDQIRYRYRMLGVDSSWVHSRDSQAIFPHLSPGDYVFELQVTLPTSSLIPNTSRLFLHIERPFWQQVWVVLLITLIVMGAIRFWMYKREQALKHRQRLENQTLVYQFETLRHQINPHFLFNSFNTLLGMIEENSNRAALFVEKLADLFRNVLDYRDRMSIPLYEEKNLLDTYVLLLKERFDTGLELEWTVPEKLLQLQVPPMCLQLLVENACKHNIISASKPLLVRINYEEPDVLIVSNNLQKRRNSPVSTHLGLQNLIDRYRLLKGREIRVEITADAYCVYLPLLDPQEYPTPVS